MGELALKYMAYKFIYVTPCNLVGVYRILEKEPFFYDSTFHEVLVRMHQNTPQVVILVLTVVTTECLTLRTVSKYFG